MTGTNRFQGAQFQLAGMIAGGDERGHLVFSVTPKEGTPLYGEYFMIFEKNENDFNIEIGMFGYWNNTSVGTTHPAFRLAFSAEDCLAVEQSIASFFSDNRKLPRSIGAEFLGAFVFGLIGPSRKLPSGGSRSREVGSERSGVRVDFSGCRSARAPARSRERRPAAR
jgi:hypothetical protein